MNTSSIKAREIPDSNGKPTVEVELETEAGKFKASVPSGISTGKYEAKTVAAKIAVRNINGIALARLKGTQDEIDRVLKKLNIGANATTAVSMAVCRAGAAARKIPLYQYIREIGNWKLYSRNWKLEIGNWKLANAQAFV